MHQKMNWKRFPGRPNTNKANADELRVTMRPDLTIYLNKAAFEALERPDAVELIYEEQQRVIGMLLGDTTAANHFPISYNDKNKVRCIHAAAFCRHFGIKIDKTILFHSAGLDDEKILRLELKETVGVGRGAR